ncbi:MAG: stalk domain-containing protein [Caldisericia bacterium]|nr:stalk domain-containing protein [Caldisericia bacterium]
MKRIISFFLSLLLVGSLFSTVFAAETKVITMVVGETEVLVNGESVFLDVPPTIVEGRTLVPLRFIAETFGAEVEWDAVARSITLTAPDAAVLQQMMEALTAQNETLQQNLEDLQEENEKHQSTIASLEEDNEVLSEKVGLMDTLITKLEDQIADLLEENGKLSKEIEELKKKIDAGDGSQDTTPPNIVIQNLSPHEILEEDPLTLDISIEDDSLIVFSRVFLNSVLLSETLGKYGEIHPTKLVSGDYFLKVEAIDGHGNVGTTTVPFTVKHDLKKEPIRFALRAIDLSSMPGMSATNKESLMAATSQPYLIAHFQNQSMSSYEVQNVEAFDAEGNVFQPMPGMNFYDLMKEQMGLPEHLTIVSNDEYSTPCAISLTEQNMTPEEYFDGWDIKITLYDSIRELEFIKTIRYSR